MMEKSILITGSTDGIGKLAAIQLAEAGHQVLLHGRKRDKVAAVVTEVKALTNNDQVQGFVADFSDLDQVRQMAQEVTQTMSKLDVLINNAGVFNSSVSYTKFGLDVRFTVNYLAPYLLTNTLVPLLQKAPAPRLINLSSAAQSPVSIEALSGVRQLAEGQAYAQSKLALTMWSFHLGEVLEDVVVIALNPGSLLNTKMAREAFGKSWSSADKGANIIYDLATHDKYQDHTGQYFDNDKGTFGPAHPMAYQAIEIEKLIQATERLLGM